jgi:HEAT repeat protein
LVCTFLGQQKRAAVAALPELIELLSSEEPGVRCAAAGALAEVASDHEHVVVALAATLRDPNDGVREAVVRALGKCSRIDAACPALRQCLDDEIPWVRMGAAEELVRRRLGVHKPLQVLRQCLLDTDAQVRGPATATVSRLGPLARDLAPVALTRFHDPDHAREREEWARLLHHIAPDQVYDVVPDLTEMLREKDGSALVPLLGQFRERARGALPALEELLHEARPGSREWREVLKALSRIDPSSGVFQAHVRDCLRERTYGGFLYNWLGALHEHAAPFVPELAALLESSFPHERLQATRVLGSIGAAARAATPALRRALADEEPENRVEVLRALILITGDRGTYLPRLLAELPRNKAAFTALEVLGEKAARAAPTLIGLLEHPERDVRTLAACTLVKLGKSAALAVPQLVHLLEREPPRSPTWQQIRGVLEEAGVLPDEVALAQQALRTGNNRALLALVKRLEHALPARASPAAWRSRYLEQFEELLDLGIPY